MMKQMFLEGTSGFWREERRRKGRRRKKKTPKDAQLQLEAEARGEPEGSRQERSWKP